MYAPNNAAEYIREGVRNPQFDVNVRDDIGRTALFYCRSYHVVKALVLAGIDIHALAPELNGSQWSAIYFYTRDGYGWEGQWEIVDYLLQRGASLHHAVRGYHVFHPVRIGLPRLLRNYVLCSKRCALVSIALLGMRKRTHLLPRDMLWLLARCVWNTRRNMDWTGVGC